MRASHGRHVYISGGRELIRNLGVLSHDVHIKFH